MPLDHIRRVTARVQPSGTDARLVDELERLSSLRQQGALDDDEYEAAKRKLLGGGSW